MATRSRIGYTMKSGMIRHIYVHWDGYPDGVGKTLYQHYDTYGKIKQLIDLGDISQLGEEIGEMHNFEDRLNTSPKDIESGKVKVPWKDSWTLAYGRDRGEKKTKPKVSKTRASYGDTSKNWDIEYFYLFDEGEWYVLDTHRSRADHKKQWDKLGEVLGLEKPKGEEDSELIHGESNPFAEKMLKVIRGQYTLQEEQMGTNNDTAIKIQREAKKTALRLYKQIYDNLFLASQALLEMPKEYVDGSTFGQEGPFTQVYAKVKETLDAMTKVASPEVMSPEEVMPIEEPTEAPSEVAVGGEDDLEPLNVE
jgi:hypothetical protein